MPDPIVSFKPQTSDARRPGDNPFQGSDIIKGTVTNSLALPSNGAVGFAGSFNTSLSALNLDLIIPDVEVHYHADTSLGGGISRRTYRKLPFTTIDTNGLVSERAQYSVNFQFDNTKGQTPISGTTLLTIEYYNRNSSSAGQIFDYKIKSSRAQTITQNGFNL